MRHRVDADAGDLIVGMREGTRYRIHAPLISLTKAAIIRRGLELGVDYSLTRSCYAPDAQGRACGECDSCRIRRKGFADVGIADPVDYIRGG